VTRTAEMTTQHFSQGGVNSSTRGRLL